MTTTEVRSARPPAGSSARGGRGVRTWVVLVLCLGVGAGAGLLWWTGAGPLSDPEGCRARVGDRAVSLTTAQAEHASLIAAVAIERGLPARAVSIALATAFQESRLRNLRHGDRDSVGLFQQRPSQGWGSREQLLDPHYAAEAFYDALVKVEGYQQMRITEAAQRVQRSAYPEAYEQHAAGARALASALTGYSPGRFSCVVDRSDAAVQEVGETGLTARAERVRQDVTSAFGQLSMGGFDPAGVSSGHMEGSAHYEGRAIDLFVRPVTEENRRHGWAIASYLVANADRLQLDHVIFDARIWSSGRHSEAGWREYTPSGAEGAAAGTRAVLEHRDHVHLDVVAGG